MHDRSPGWLFRKRNILGAALVAGVVAGMYLPDFWNGFGGGSSIGVGIGDPKSGNKLGVDPAKDEQAALPEETKTRTPENSPSVIKVVIDDRSFYLRNDEGDKLIELNDIIALTKSTTGDADGIRVRIYRKGTSRVTAEDALQQALTTAKIEDSAIVWIPTPIN